MSGLLERLLVSLEDFLGICKCGGKEGPTGTALLFGGSLLSSDICSRLCCQRSQLVERKIPAGGISSAMSIDLEAVRIRIFGKTPAVSELLLLLFSRNYKCCRSGNMFSKICEEGTGG